MAEPLKQQRPHLTLKSPSLPFGPRGHRTILPILLAHGRVVWGSGSSLAPEPRLPSSEVGMGVVGWSAWAVEGRTVLQPEVIGRLGRPQPHGIDRVVLIAGHWSVIGHGEHHLATGTRMGHSQQDLPPTRTGATGTGVQAAQWQPGPQCPSAPGASPLRTRPTRASLLHPWGPSALTRGQTGHPHQQHCCGPSLPSSESLSTRASPAHHGTNI